MHVCVCARSPHPTSVISTVVIAVNVVVVVTTAIAISSLVEVAVRRAVAATVAEKRVSVCSSVLTCCILDAGTSVSSLITYE